MNAQTPGQAAYEAWRGDEFAAASAPPWTDLGNLDHAGWEAAAQAVLAAVMPAGADTPGRAAFEAYSVAESGKGLVSIPWDEMPDSVHSWWETGARAAIAAAQGQPAPEPFRLQLPALTPEQTAAIRAELEQPGPHVPFPIEDAKPAPEMVPVTEARAELERVALERDEARAALAALRSGIAGLAAASAPETAEALRRLLETP